MNTSIIQKDTYKVTGGDCVWVDPYIDPDTGEFSWVVSEAENWIEI
jgi:hypothetical protein